MWLPSKLVGTVILACTLSLLPWQKPVERKQPIDSAVHARLGLFHADPKHLWNRLHRHFTVRTSASGQEYGFDALDPLLWPDTEYLLTGESHQKALELLEEFLRVGGDRLISDPLKRALLQRDLWSVFDWSAQRKDNYSAARTALRAKLGPVLWRLALPEEQVSALPDNYRQAVASGRFATEYDPSRSDSPFLPPGLFEARGPWVALLAMKPVAPTHLSVFSGRSVFHAFLRLPGGRKATLDYLAKLWHFPRPWPTETPLGVPLGRLFPLPLNPEVPQFPAGTQAALLRRMMLFDADGKLRDTPMTEMVQIRVYREVPAISTRLAMRSQDFCEFNLSRDLLLAGEAGGLRPEVEDETKFRIFGSHGVDVFDKNTKSRPLECVNCHAGPGIHSLRTVEALLPPQPLISDPAEDDPKSRPLHWEASMTVNWKESRYDWGLLNALRPAPSNQPSQ